MASYPENDLSWCPPWYWAPYVIALGAQDWWQEVTGRKHKEVFSGGISAIKSNKHRLFRLISSVILIFLLYLFIVKWILAPAILAGALAPSSSELLWSTAVLAVVSLALVAITVLAWLKRGMASLYARGLNTLRTRRSLLYKLS